VSGHYFHARTGIGVFWSATLARFTVINSNSNLLPAGAMNAQYVSIWLLMATPMGMLKYNSPNFHLHGTGLIVQRKLGMDHGAAILA
jgi:hypothetical protein